MSRIDDLIAKHCPDGVEFKALASLGRRNPGTSITAGKMKTIAVEAGPVRVFAGGQTVADVAEDAIPQKDIVRQPSIIVKSRGHIGFTYYEQPFTHKSELWSYTLTVPEINQKFIYYYLLTKVEELQEIARATSVKLPQLGVRDTDNLKVPVPPLEIQREIVKILDTFTELEAELEARQRQYKYYRDALLSVSAKRTTLGEICKSVTSGGTPLSTKPDYYDGDIPWLRTQEVRFTEIYDTEVKITAKGLANSSAKWIPENNVIVAISGAGVTRGRVAINKIPLTTNQHCCNLEIDATQANYRFVFYWLIHHYEDLRSRGQGNRSDLNISIIKNYPISLPPLEEQARIVAILDKFDTLINDLSTGIPAEIAARRQQYEYYRDRLLTFKEAA